MGWAEEILCIKCSEAGNRNRNRNGKGNLLICRENSCPLAIHEGCLSGCPARFDDAGRFYCPYCWYRRAVAESRGAREHALAKKKALMIFMDEEAVDSGKRLDENRMPEGRKDCGGGGGGDRPIDEEGEGEEVRYCDTGRDSTVRVSGKRIFGKDDKKSGNETAIADLRRSKRSTWGSENREAALGED